MTTYRYIYISHVHVHVCLFCSCCHASVTATLLSAVRSHDVHGGTRIVTDRHQPQLALFREEPNGLQLPFVLHVTADDPGVVALLAGKHTLLPLDHHLVAVYVWEEDCSWWQYFDSS